MASNSQRGGDITDLELLARDLASAFPGLAPVAPLRVIGAGFRSLAVETACGDVLRIGRRPEALAGYEREFHLLPVIAGSLPVAIPNPLFRAGPDERFPFGVTGYEALPGVSLHPTMLARTEIGGVARTLGAFLYALHSVPVEVALSEGVPDPAAWLEDLDRQRATILPAAWSLFTVPEYAIIERWWDTFLAERAKTRFTPVLCHADLWYEHVLVDEPTLAVTGILDFESARLADPALDLATQTHLGEPFAALVLAAYFAAGAQANMTLPQRIRRLWEHREFDGLADALRVDDEGEIADAVAKIRRGPILAPQA